MTAPLVKGWCPGAFRPMASGDGLVVRVRPWMGELTALQALALCAVAERFGTSALEVTSRANLQIRGVSEADHGAVIDALLTAELLDADPAMEGRRNLLMTPDWQAGDMTHGLAEALLEALSHLPDLPAKFGYAIDTGTEPWLAEAPADIRLECDATGGLILVADGAGKGRAVTPKAAIPALIEMVGWFVNTGGRDAGRMARHVRATPLPADWEEIPRRVAQRPSTSAHGTLVGVPFGQIDTASLRAFIDGGAVKTLRVLPGRLLLATGTALSRPDGFCAPDDPILNVHACTGAPGCPQALGPTRPLARALARTLAPGETLHISGCTKGCAHPRAADRTYVATPSGFDLVSRGAPWDAPIARDLTPDVILKSPPQG
ncbi:hypothetical protein A8B78_10850 [Jannaschia sp. EhC01]|nr:hypothetical protein A8B78_10850 [Jannaschia sp. EhC01]